MKNQTISRIFTGTALTWLTIPLMIFLFGWLKIYIAIALAVGVMISVCLAVYKSPVWEMPRVSKKEISVIIFCAVLIAGWIFTSGIGGYMFQNDDFYYRNAVLKDLVNNDFPVIFDDEGYALVYYFAFFLPAAVVGKILNFKFALAALYIWSFIGVLITWVGISIKLKKFRISSAALLILFSGMDIIGTLIFRKPLSFTEHIEWWADVWQFSSNSTQLFWVFNQSIPTWMIMSLFLLSEKKSSLVLLLGFLLLYAPMPFVGALPFFIWRMIPKEKNLKKWVKELFTIENLIGGGIIGIISFLFLSTNLASGEKKLYPFTFDDGLKYVVFLLLEFGILAIFLYKNNKKSSLYWISAGVLTLAPMIQVGIKEDFGMRASIPALFILMYLSLKMLCENKNRLLKFAVLAIICIGGVTSALEISRSIINTASGEEIGKYAYSTVLQSHEDLKPNFLGDMDSIFFKYLAKQPKGREL